MCSILSTYMFVCTAFSQKFNALIKLKIRWLHPWSAEVEDSTHNYKIKGSKFSTCTEREKNGKKVIKKTILHFAECHWDGCHCTILWVDITIRVRALNVFLSKNVESTIWFHMINIYVCIYHLFSEIQYAQKTRWLHPSIAEVERRFNS